MLPTAASLLLKRYSVVGVCLLVICAFLAPDLQLLLARQVTDPYLNVFRGFLPPLLGSVDFTPLLGFFMLQFLFSILAQKNPAEPGFSDFDSEEWNSDTAETQLVYGNIYDMQDMPSGSDAEPW